MSANKRARCPLCRQSTPTYTHEGRRFYMFHTHSGATILDDVECEATGWLVEDDELIVTPRGPSPLKDIAQPSKSVCRRCLGEGLYEGDLCRCCGGTGTTTPVPPPPSERKET